MFAFHHPPAPRFPTWFQFPHTTASRRRSSRTLHTLIGAGTCLASSFSHPHVWYFTSCRKMSACAFVRRLGAGRSFAARLSSQRVFGGAWPMAGRALISSALTSHSPWGVFHRSPLLVRHFCSSQVARATTHQFVLTCQWTEFHGHRLYSTQDGSDSFEKVVSASTWVNPPPVETFHKANFRFF